MAVGNHQLYHASALLDITDIATIASLIGVLDAHSKALASDENLRYKLYLLPPSYYIA